MAENQTETEQLSSEQKRKRMGKRTLPDGRKVQDISFLLDALDDDVGAFDRLVDPFYKESYPEITQGSNHKPKLPASVQNLSAKTDANDSYLITSLKKTVSDLEKEERDAKNAERMKLPSLKK